MKKLPIGIQSFIKMREDNFYYVDKTSMVSELVNKGGGLNILQNITLNAMAATVCGYTHEELLATFADRLDGVDLEEVRIWYDSYNFLGDRVTIRSISCCFWTRKNFETTGLKPEAQAFSSSSSPRGAMPHRISKPSKHPKRSFLPCFDLLLLFHGAGARWHSQADELFLIGVEFSSAERNIVGFEWERV